MKEIEFEGEDIIIIDPKSDEEEKKRNEYAEALWKKRSRKGVTLYDAKKMLRERNYFAAMMVEKRRCRRHAFWIFESLPFCFKTYSRAHR